MSELLDPRLQECRKIFLRDFTLDVSIGFHAAEREARQPVVINIDLFVRLASSSSKQDDVRDVLDYDGVRLALIEFAHSRHFNLQETLLDGIVAICLAHSGVHAVRASTEKPGVYPDCRTVGVEVFQLRNA